MRIDTTLLTPHEIATLRLETPRLTLRPPRLEDFEPWAELIDDPVAARFIGGRQPRNIAWRSAMAVAGAWYLQGFAMFSVLEKPSGRWVGRVGPWMPEGWPGTEVGWMIVPACWGRGYAVEAAAAAIDWAFERLGWDDVIHVIDPDNVASQRVAMKLGSQNRGPGRLPPPYEGQTVDIWGQTRAEWQQKKV
jgi:RimJ/RimL family protein N-acetyltransferase